MGLADKLKKLTTQATDAAAEHKEQIEQAVEKAASVAEQRTGGKYHDKIAKAEQKAHDYVEHLDSPPATDNESGGRGGS